MKKNMIGILLITLMISFTGCGKVQELSNQIETRSDSSIYGEVSTYKYNSANSRFEIVSVEQIDDGSKFGENISILVDKETKIMYAQTEKHDMGYGLALQVMVDKDGKPLIYNGSLN